MDTVSESVENILRELKRNESENNRDGMERFGINVSKAFGVSMPSLQAMARQYENQHELALALWQSGFHETQILACLVDDPRKTTKEQMREWAAEFDSWDVCDQCCNKLFVNTPYAYELAHEWANESAEYVKRAGFVMMATLAVHDKKATDEQLESFFELIEKHASDERNFVKKAVNWALRQLGKRNKELNTKAIVVAMRVQAQDSKASRWVAKDALRELQSEKVQSRFH